MALDPTNPIRDEHKQYLDKEHRYVEIFLEGQWIRFNRQEPKVELGEYQLCPKCFGDGHLMRYNSPSMSTTAMPICDVCQGKKIIARPPL